MTPAIMCLARYFAKQGVKAQYQRQGIRAQHIPAFELHQATDAYLSQHREELIEKACAALATLAQKPKL